MREVKTIKATLEEAKTAEDSEELDTAVESYESVLQQDALNEHAYDRLMIIYRKLKDRKKELATIDKATKAFQKFYKSKKSTSKKITEISNKLNRSFGFTDKKGEALYMPEPIARWQKRKRLLEKSTKKKK